MSAQTYAEKLRDPRWQKTRLNILDRDKFTCRDCGRTDRTLHVHHCFYERGDPWDMEENCLLTLCVECHENRQSFEDKVRNLLGFGFAVLRFDRPNSEMHKLAECLGAAIDLLLEAREERVRLVEESQIGCPTK